MFNAVHTDQSGRAYVSADHGAAAHDGGGPLAFAHGIAVPPGTSLLPMPREAQGLDRAGRARPLGRGRLALAAILPPGYLRTLLPAYREAADPPLERLPYAAVAADEEGQIVVAALAVSPRAGASGVEAATIAAAPGAPENEGPRLPLDLGAGGAEPLLAIRELEAAVRAARERDAAAKLHLETNGSRPAALRRAIDAGIGSVTIRMASAQPDTYEVLHGPRGYRWADVRASLQLVGEREARLAIALLVMPGLTDREGELDALSALLGELPGGIIELRELGADPLGVLAGLPRARPLGMPALLERISAADHFRLAAALEPTPA